MSFELTKNPVKTHFSDEELMLYSRHIMLPKMDVAGQLALANSTILIIGVGGLGSAVAQYLAASGVGNMILADHDRVDASNLQRQVIHNIDSVNQFKVDSAKSAINKLNPWVNVIALPECLQDERLLDVVSQVELVVDCSDNFSTRMAVNKACLQYRKPLVSGAAIRMEGQITAFDFRRADSPCYQCLYDLAGDESLTCSQSGVLSPLVGVIGCMQAVETMKMLVGFGKDKVGFGKDLVGRVQFYDAAAAQWREFRLQKDKDCKVCGDC